MSACRARPTDKVLPWPINGTKTRSKPAASKSQAQTRLSFFDRTDFAGALAGSQNKFGDQSRVSLQFGIRRAVPETIELDIREGHVA